MSKMISISEVSEWLITHDNYLILTHVRPDGDTLGSAGALAHELQRLGKVAYLLHNPQTTSRYTAFVKNYRAADDFVPSFVIAVDTASMDLLPTNAMKYQDSISLCIDHHATNKKYAQKICLYSDYASCGEIVYEILLQLASNKLSERAAECLYVAVSTDTGCFSFGNTTANSLEVASRLVRYGADNKKLNKALFRTKTHQRTRIEGMIISGMEFYFDDKVAIATITREMMETSGADEDDIDDISSVPSSIEGVGIGITLRELSSKTDCKISVRTSPPYNAGDLCTHFNGGGHYAAAGATSEKTIAEVKDELLTILESFV